MTNLYWHCHVLVFLRFFFHFFFTHGASVVRFFFYYVPKNPVLDEFLTLGRPVFFLEVRYLRMGNIHKVDGVGGRSVVCDQNMLYTKINLLFSYS